MDLARQQPHQRDLASHVAPLVVVDVVEQQLQPLGPVPRPVEPEGEDERQVDLPAAPLAGRAGRQAAEQGRGVVGAARNAMTSASGVVAAGLSPPDSARARRASDSASGASTRT